jgi:hypothetical protein
MVQSLVGVSEFFNLKKFFAFSDRKKLKNMDLSVSLFGNLIGLSFVSVLIWATFKKTQQRKHIGIFGSVIPLWLFFFGLRFSLSFFSLL